MSLQIKPRSTKTPRVNKAIKDLQEDVMVKLTFNIPKKMRSDLKITAERNGTNMTEIVTQYIKQYIQQ